MLLISFWVLSVFGNKSDLDTASHMRVNSWAGAVTQIPPVNAAGQRVAKGLSWNDHRVRTTNNCKLATHKPAMPIGLSVGPFVRPLVVWEHFAFSALPAFFSISGPLTSVHPHAT